MAELPEPGVTPSPIWAPQLNAAIQENTDTLEVYGMAGVELARGSNDTGTPTTVAIYTNPAIAIPGCMITVPPDLPDAWIEYGCGFSVVSTGGGLLTLQLFDVTAGGAGTEVHALGLGNVAAMAVLYSGLSRTLNGRFPLDPSASERQFQIKAQLFRDTSSTLTAQVDNGQFFDPSYVRLVQQ